MAESLTPDSQGRFLADLKGRIRAAQLRASTAVDRELLLLCWHIGRDILDRQERENWGAKVIDRLLTPEVYRFESYLRSQIFRCLPGPRLSSSGCEEPL